VISIAGIGQLVYRGDTGAVRFPAGAINFLFSTASKPVLGPNQPHIPWVPGAPREKRQRREADHQYLSSAEVKIAGNIPPLKHNRSLKVAVQWPE
jgi:hypothetical protein